MADAALRSYDITQLNILVLEKHVLLRQLLTDVFNEFGVATTISTSDPDKAYRMFQKFPPDIVLTDWSYDLDGLGFVRKIRNNDDSPNPFVPIVVISANTTVQHLTIARDMGMTAYITKPITAKFLYSRVVGIIEDSRAYIRNSTFFGPDRRRRSADDFAGTERRRAGFA